MKFYTDIVVKIFFLFSTLPFLVSEKIYEKYDFRLSNRVVDTIYSGPLAMGTLDNKKINEASGLAYSLVHPSIIYTHNDSGGEPAVYMIDTLGQYQGKIMLEGVHNQDWEDISVVQKKGAGPAHIYVGDIGDNKSRRNQIHVYRFQEPVEIKKEISIRPEKLTLKYPDGPKDAETLMVDPWNDDILVLTKRDTSNVFYRAPASKLKDGEVVLEKIMRLPITLAVGGDISADGRQIVIKNYWAIYYWTREEGQSIADALSGKPVQLPYKPEPQGEAIGFSPDGSYFYTLSEKRFRIAPVLYRHQRIGGT